MPAQIVFTKVDKLSASARGVLRERARASFRGGRRSAGPLFVSGETGEGVDALWAAIFDAIRGAAPAPRRTCGGNAARLASCGKARMAVNKLQQAFDVEPMRLADLDAVMAIERRLVSLAR